MAFVFEDDQKATAPAAGVDGGRFVFEDDEPAGPVIRQGKAPSLVDRVFDLFENPDKERAKAVQALVDAEVFNIRPSDAMRYRDAIDSGVKLNKNAIAASRRTGVMDRIGQSWDIGVKQVQVGLYGSDVVMNNNAESFKTMQEIQSTMPGEDETFIPESKLEYAFSSAAKMSPMMFQVMKESVKKGIPAAMGVGGAVALLGQAGPQALLPEEAVTVPVGAAIGFKAGATGAAFTEALKLESGLAFSEFLMLKDDQGNQIDPNIARAAAFGVGAINAGLEVAQIKTLLKTVPGLDKLVGKAVMEAVTSKALKDRLASVATMYAGTVAKETAQELAQESTNIVMEELSKVVNNKLKGTDIDPATVEGILDRLADTAKESAMAFSVMAAPGASLRALPTGKRKSTPDAAGSPSLTDQDTVKTETSPADKTPQGPFILGVNEDANGEVKSFTMADPVSGETFEVAALRTEDKDTLRLIPDMERETEIDANLDQQINVLIESDTDIDQVARELFGEQLDDVPDFIDEAKPETILSRVKAINDSIGEKGSIDFEPLVDLGRSIWSEGHTTIEAFTARAKELLSDVWDKVQYHIQAAWEILNNERGSVNIEGVTTPKGTGNITAKDNPTPEAALIGEAKKYKSADEFIDTIRGNASQYRPYAPHLRKYGTTIESARLDSLGINPDQTITIYRGINKMDVKNPQISDGDYVTTDYDSAKSYGGDNVISKTVKVKDLIVEYPDEFNKNDPFQIGSEFVYSDSKNQLLKYTDERLTDIWNKAHSPAKTTPQAEAGYLKIKGKDTIGRDIPDWRNATVYHATSKDGYKDISKNGYRILGEEADDGQGGYYGEAVSFTPTKTYADQFGEVLTRAQLPSNIKILNLNDAKDWDTYLSITKGGRDLAKLREYVVNAGYDGVYDAGAGDLFLYNPEKAKLLPNPSRPPEVGGQSTLYSGVDPTQIIPVLKSLTNNIQEAMPHLEALGLKAYESGKSTYSAWSAEMKSYLGDLWESFKGSMATLWESVKAFNESLGERGSFSWKKKPTTEEINMMLSAAARQDQATGGNLAPESYLDLQAQAAQEAFAVIEKKMTRTQKREAAMLARQGEADARLMPVYSAMSHIVNAGGMSLKSLQADYDGNTIRELMNKRPGLVSNKGTMGPDVFADQHGFESGDDMINAILDWRGLKAEGKAQAKEFLKYYEKVIATDDMAAMREEFERAEQKALDRLTKKYQPKSDKGIKREIRQRTGQTRAGDRFVTEYDALTEAFRKEANTARRAFSEGKKEEVERSKEAMRWLVKRRKSLQNVRDYFNLTDAEMMSATNRRNPALMDDAEFKQFLRNVELKAVELAETRQEKMALLKLIEDKRLKKVDNYRRALELPTFNDMTAQQLRDFAKLLEPFQDDDIFLTQRELETVDRTDLKGIKTWREARERLAKEAGVPVEELNKVHVEALDSFRWDTSLRERDPFFGILVEQMTQSYLGAQLRAHEIENRVYELARKSEKVQRQGHY